MASEREARAEATRPCPYCDGFEVWILDCYELVECPNGVNDFIHLHARCGRCGHEQVLDYEDDGPDPSAPAAVRVRYVAPRRSRVLN